MLPQTEEIELKKIIGKDNYKLMLADLKDFSAVTDWNEDTVYTLGNKVRFDGTVYELNVATQSGGSEPDCSNKWTEVEIFNTACYNRVWYTGRIRDIICWYIYAAAAPFYPNILQVAGWNQEIDNTGKDAMNYYLNHIYREIAKMKQVFVCWYDDDEDNRCMTIDYCNKENIVTSDQNRTNRKVAW